MGRTWILLVAAPGSGNKMPLVLAKIRIFAIFNKDIFSVTLLNGIYGNAEFYIDK